MANELETSAIDVVVPPAVKHPYKSRRPSGTPKKPAVALIPENDGVTHINVYSRGKTELGRFLNNLEKTPFTVPEYGKFASVIGYWKWLSTGKIHEMFRKLYGFEANRQARDIPLIPMEGFEEEIKKGLRCKIDQHPTMRASLATNKLPLVSYFVYENTDPTVNAEYVIKEQPQLIWQLEYMQAYIQEYLDEISGVVKTKKIK